MFVVDCRKPFKTASKVLTVYMFVNCVKVPKKC